MSDLVGDARHLSPSAQEALRLRAVAALVAGRDREDVAAVFGVSLKAVDGWWAKWQAGGREALVMRPRGKPVGVHQMLDEAEQAAARQAVLDHRPCEVGLGGQLWTRRLVGEQIAKLYRVRLTEPGVGKYLKRWGLSFQRPDKRAVEQDPQAVRRWHEETWLLDRLDGHFDHKIHLVVDGHSAHRSRKVRDWLTAHPDNVELHFLPPYSPELNPDEPVNADLKHSLPRQHRARNQAELAAETAASSADADVSRTSSAATSAAYTSATPGREPHEFLINRATCFDSNSVQQRHKTSSTSVVRSPHGARSEIGTTPLQPFTPYSADRGSERGAAGREHGRGSRRLGRGQRGRDCECVLPRRRPHRPDDAGREVVLRPWRHRSPGARAGRIHPGGAPPRHPRTAAHRRPGGRPGQRARHRDAGTGRPGLILRRPAGP
ncbi:winged helix-turn-helix domain-containing protein [Streptomyces sp. YIM S03343]